MATAAELLHQGRRDEVWKKYCGFLDLSLGEFVEIQERLLVEQIAVLGRCELGHKLFGDKVPQSVREFRERVPLTSYRDYLPYLAEKRSDMLPAAPHMWVRTSGRSTEYTCKWAPYSKEMVSKVGEFAIASFILASCSDREDVRLGEKDVCLYTLAPAPYFTGGAVAGGLSEELEPVFIPSLQEGDRMSFEERIASGFRQALRTGIDFFYGLSSVLVAVAEQFKGGDGQLEFSTEMLHPRLLYRVVKGFLQSKLGGRELLPRDLWKVKGIVAGGMDTAFFRDAIEASWGRKPLEGYGGTELGGIALQAWNYRGMTFLPDCNYLEFIPADDFYQNALDPDSELSVKRLDEIRPGVYELVITNFHGGAFTRYRTGDLIEITALGDSELGIDIPQMVFHARADGVLDLGGFTRLTEKAVWQAIEESALSYTDWTIRKEYVDERPKLHLYIELKDQRADGDIAMLVHQKLKDKDPGYSDLESMLDFNPLMVTILSEGAFARYVQDSRQAGAELAHMKPPHINPKDDVIKRLVEV